jgi:hypothetical protein
MSRDSYGRHQVEMMEKLVIATAPIHEPAADTVATWRALLAKRDRRPTGETSSIALEANIASKSV